MKLRLLLAEDTDADAVLVLRAITQAGFDLDVHRVQSETEFSDALKSGEWDAIVSDHAMPQFSSSAGLAALRRDGRDIPFIVVSGTIGEDAAVSLLRSGVHDFVTKQNLARLGPALRRELKEAENRAQHRKAQADLRAQRDFLRTVIDASPDLVFVRDHSGRFLLANEATARLYGTTVDALTEGGFTPPADSVLGASISTGGAATQRRSVEAINHPRTGKTGWFDVLLVPLPGTNGTQHLIVAADITDRKRTADALTETEAQLMHAQKMEAIGQLAGGIAHDFNNLLTVILGFSQIAIEKAVDQPSLSADLAEIFSSGQRASLLTRQLLTFSRKQVMEMKPLQINAIVAELDKLLRRVIGEDVRLVTNLAPALSWIYADAGQVEQVIMNLVVNARDAMPNGGTLTIDTAESAPFVQLTVRDTGTGMTPEVRARIFEPFFTTKPDGKGTGLGLSTVYGIVKQCGGDIAVDSAVAQGTAITVKFPSVAAPVAAQGNGSAAQSLGGSAVILLVEDEEAVRVLVERGLMRYGYEVHSASSADAALAFAATFKRHIDLMITDVVMPVMRGPTLARVLREQRPDTVVLYVSGFMDRADSEGEDIELSTNFLHKPFTPSQLAEKVRDVLNQHNNDRGRS